MSFGAKKKRKVTFNVDMSPFDFTQFADSSEFKGVYLNGSFNGWCGECDNKMDDLTVIIFFQKLFYSILALITLYFR